MFDLQKFITLINNIYDEVITQNNPLTKDKFKELELKYSFTEQIKKFWNIILFYYSEYQDYDNIKTIKQFNLIISDTIGKIFQIYNTVQE